MFLIAKYYRDVGPDIRYLFHIMPTTCSLKTDEENLQYTILTNQAFDVISDWLTGSNLEVLHPNY